MSYPGIDAALAELARRTIAIRMRCLRGEVAALSDSTRRELAALDRAGAFVWLAAALETFIKNLCIAVVQELNSCAIPHSDAKLPLFALLAAPSLDSLQQIRGHDMWEARAKLFLTTMESVQAAFNPDTVPVTGKTIRPENFDLLWAVFGFDGRSSPSPRHRAVLTDLANTRNRIAHGEEDPEKVGRSRTSMDVEKVIAVVDDFAEHACVSAESYLFDRLYLR